jgi:hypothetical protein
MPVGKLTRGARRAQVALRLLAVAVVAVVVAGSPARAQDDGPAYTHPIAVQALAYQDTYHGQCWTFVHQVVSEATGLTLGFDYRQGYFEAGAWEVSLAEAREGDVIQLADDSYTASDADYPGLHTSIVLENRGDGTFLVIDANSNWDGMVRVHESNPEDSAGRYAHIDVHVYRFPLDGATAPAGDAPGTAEAGETGESGDSEAADTGAGFNDETLFMATVNTPDDCLNFRTEPGLGHPTFTCLAHGRVVHVLNSAAVEADGYTWVNVATPEGRGWVAMDYLTPISDEDAAAAADLLAGGSGRRDAGGSGRRDAGAAGQPEIFRTYAVGVTAN